MNTTPEPWWKGFYDDHLAEMLLEQTSEDDIRRTADFLESALELKAGDRVLDQCCGSGRMTWALARRGYCMLGVDLIPGYIERARGREDASGLELNFAMADAFSFQANPAAAGAFNWWTSFGYAEDDDVNLQMLLRARDSLLPGGRYALDFMNVPGLFRHFQPQVVTRCQRPDGDVILIRESTLELARGVIRKLWTYLLPDGQRVVHRSTVRLYDPPALLALFRRAGFGELAVFGDTDGALLTLNSPRCVVVGRRCG